MPQPPPSFPRDLRGRPFTRQQALAGGATRRLLKSSQVRHPFPGVYCDAELPDTLHLRCWCAITWLPQATVAGLSALGLRDIALPSLYRPDERIHLVAPPGACTRSPRGIVVHRFTIRPDIRPVPGVGGLFAMAPLEAWVACAVYGVGTEELVVLGDRLLDRRRPLVQPQQLDAAVAGAAGRPGVAALRAAAALVRPRTDSPMETWLRLRIRAAGLPEPEVNPRVNGYGGIPIGLIDLAYLRWRIAVFYDGDFRRTNRFDWHKDSWNDAYLADDGWIVIRAGASHIGRVGELTGRIELAIATQQGRGVPPYRAHRH